MWLRILSLIVKEFLAVWRDPKSRFILLGPPVIEMLIFAYAATQEVKNVPIAVLNRHAAERPKGILQADGKRGETLAAQHRLGMLPGRVSQHEMIQPMVQRLAGDTDAGVGHVSANSPRPRDAGGNRVRVLFPPAVHHHPGALGREPDGHGPADAAGRSGHQRHLAVEQAHRLTFREADPQPDPEGDSAERPPVAARASGPSQCRPGPPTGSRARRLSRWRRA